MNKWLLVVARKILALVALTLLGGLLSASLVRFAPGYGVDERELDPRLRSASVESIRKERAQNSGLLHFYLFYLSRAVRGDFGESETFQQPISTLIKDRLPTTARSVLAGISSAWVVAFAFACASLARRGWLFALPATVASASLLALPSAVIAVLSVYLRLPVFVALGAVIFPRLFRYTRNLLADAQAQPHVFAARARGVGRWQILLRHVLPPAAPGMLSLGGVSASIAFGAAIPIEALCDSTGIGQLAWNAALNRDLPLVTSLTLIVTILTVACNSLATGGISLIDRSA